MRFLINAIDVVLQSQNKTKNKKCNLKIYLLNLIKLYNHCIHFAVKQVKQANLIFDLFLDISRIERRIAHRRSLHLATTSVERVHKNGNCSTKAA